MITLNGIIAPKNSGNQRRVCNERILSVVISCQEMGKDNNGKIKSGKTLPIDFYSAYSIYIHLVKTTTRCLNDHCHFSFFVQLLQ